MFLIGLFSNTKIWGISAIALLLSASPLPAGAQVVESQAPESDDRVPYRLLIPLIQPFSLPGAEDSSYFGQRVFQERALFQAYLLPGAEAPQLQIGAEPPALPVDLPTPPTAAL